MAAGFFRAPTITEAHSFVPTDRDDMTAVRVRNPHRHGRVLFLVLGAVTLASLLTDVVIPPPLPNQYESLISPLFVVTALLLLLIIPRFCQHLTWCAAYGAVIGGVGAYGVPILLAFSFGQRNAVLPVNRGAMAFVLLCTLAAAIGSAGMVLWTLLYRHFSCRVVMQDGTLCPSCAYDVRYTSTAKCPECGNEFNSSKLARGRTLGAVLTSRPRRRWIKYALALVASIMVVCALFIAKDLPPLYVLHTAPYWNHALSKSEAKRGEAFYQLVCTLSDRAKSGRVVSTGEVRATLGDPAYQVVAGPTRYYTYVYNNKKDEAYLGFTNDQLSRVGFNSAGVNDHSALEPFPAENRRVDAQDQDRIGQ